MRPTAGHDDEASTAAVDIRLPGPVESFEFATRDRDEAYDFLTQAYANYHQRMAAPKEPYLLQLARKSGGSFWFDTVRHTARVRYAVAPLGYLLIYRVIAGRLGREAMGTVERLGPGAVGVTADPHDAYDGYFEDLSIHLVGVQLPILAQVAARDPDDHGASVRFTGLLPVSAAVAQNPLATGVALPAISDRFGFGRDGVGADPTSASTGGFW